MNIKRNILLNPGPATTTDTVKTAQIVPDICPRETDFANILFELQSDLIKIVHGNDNEHAAVIFSGSGTICMDVCLNSLLPENKTILIINNGEYSARAAEICKSYGLSYTEANFPIDELPDLYKIEHIINNNPSIHIVYATHNETGTGLLNPIKQIGQLAHKYNCVFVVDTISTYGMIPINIENDNIDFCMASAQKGLMAMAGLSFVIGKKSLIEDSKNYPIRSYYCNLYKQYDYFIKHSQMKFTPPVQAIYAARQAIKEYFIESGEKKFARHSRVNEAIHKNLKELGFKELINKDIQSGLVISIIYPNDDNWDYKKIHDYCYERGFTIYPGKSNLKYFRLCSFGAIDEIDINNFFIIFKEALQFCDVTIPIIY